MSVTSSPQSAHPQRSPSMAMIIAPSILVSLATTPCLLAIVAIKAASGLLAQLGSTSEEIFRGDRLPVIHPPVDLNS
jgi:hypothetical protein